MNAPARQGIPLRPDRGAVARAARTSLARAVIAVGHHAMNNSVDPVRHAKAVWPDDRAVPVLVRAPVEPASIADSPAIAPIAVALIESLTSVSAAARIFAAGIGLSLDRNAVITLPKILPPNADFIAEGKPIPMIKATTTPGPTLRPAKVAFGAAFSTELVKTGAEQVIVQSLVENLGPSLDKLLFSTAAEEIDRRPGGLFHGITPLTPSTGGGDQAMRSDLAALRSALSPVVTSDQVAIVANVAQMSAIEWSAARNDYVLLPSAAMPAGSVAMIVLPAVVSDGGGVPRVEDSKDGMAQFDDAPTGDLTGLVGSLFQAQLIGIRIILPITWAVRTPTAVSLVTGATW